MYNFTTVAGKLYGRKTEFVRTLQPCRINASLRLLKIFRISTGFHRIFSFARSPEEYYIDLLYHVHIVIPLFPTESNGKVLKSLRWYSDPKKLQLGDELFSLILSL
jgi:hypothetical protein